MQLALFIQYYSKIVSIPAEIENFDLVVNGTYPKSHFVSRRWSS